MRRQGAARMAWSTWIRSSAEANQGIGIGGNSEEPIGGGGSGAAGASIGDGFSQGMGGGFFVCSSGIGT